MYIGIDLGGTFIKGGIYDGEKVIIKEQVETGDGSPDNTIFNIASLIKGMLTATGIGLKQVKAIGVGVPGMADSNSGIVIHLANLNWQNVEFRKKLQKELDANIPVYLSNDANLAALGEATFGSGKEYNDSILVTLGTGVGGGVIIGNRIFEGNMGAGTEIGHMVIKAGGEKCNCGRRGCFESYCSATALIHQTIKAMQKDINSQLWNICGGKVENINGKTAFEGYTYDKTAKKVVDNYITYLAEGLCNLANIFRPQAIILGGGISKEGDKLVNMIKRKFDKWLFAGTLGPAVEIKLATLRNDAGFLGAVTLAMQNSNI